MKTVFASALIPVEDKKEIMDSFRNLLFAPNQTVFDSKLPEWYGLIQGIQVKVKAGAGSEWIQLSDYYDKNWAPMVDMWRDCGGVLRIILTSYMLVKLVQQGR